MGVYAHIPFCRSKCGYCAFYSAAGTSPAAMENYSAALLAQARERAAMARGRAVSTVYIGGGTPTTLPEGTLLRIIEGLLETYRPRFGAEITVEANPGTVDAAYLRALRSAGVNRLSFGMQSAHDGELRLLGRGHNYADFLRCFAWARDAGFDNISLDLMYGIPGQTRESFAATLGETVKLNPEHISVYGLTIEEGTPFHERRESLYLPDEETERAMWFGAVASLEAAGYLHYEISNFARPGRESRHNVNYWECGEYIGLGAAAHSHVDGRRFSNAADIAGFSGALDYEPPLTPEQAADEYVMLGMRMARGINKAEFTKRFGIGFDSRYGAAVAPFAASGHIVDTPPFCRFTPEGMYISNYILSRVLP